MRFVRTAPLTAVIAALVGGVLSAPATASTSDQETTWATAHAVYPSDGDTIWVCIDGDSSCKVNDSSTWTSVRLMSIQAMETRHNGEISKEALAAGVPSMTVDQCHGADATAALNTLVFGKSTWDTAKLSSLKLRLRSEREGSSSYGRLRRTVEVYNGGSWVDVQAELLKAGHVMFMPLPYSLGENAHNTEYNTLGQRAARSGKNLWDTDYCGSGPNQTAKLVIDIKYDANGNDLTNVNGEWIRIRNMGTTAIDLKGYSIRTASWQVYDFTTSTIVGAKNWIMVHSGKKPSTVKSRHYYMGKAKPFLLNSGGGGAYLFDKQGDMRAWSMYMCLTSCPTNPGLDITKVNANAKGNDFTNVNGEYIVLKNTSTKTILLAPYMLKEGGQQFSFSAGAYLRAGESVKVRVGKGKNTHFTKYMGYSKPTLPNGGGKVQLRTYTGLVLDCKSWGTGHC